MNTEENRIRELTKELIDQDIEVEILRNITNYYIQLTEVLYERLQNQPIKNT